MSSFAEARKLIDANVAALERILDDDTPVPHDPRLPKISQDLWLYQGGDEYEDVAMVRIASRAQDCVRGTSR